ncbi:hypothetical protein ATE84_2882 [Aquimarina sp. MAR_2010_214]|uniref:hypothetical protein n=1 Tax=Aquimarina sp. MAR_2010_214 TaxID=1250026 RepID=UPI000C7084D3|nr:hypothetical protein [Aquimarina sp. MAR_2010_214]PKV50815.1 hypothetical protein ATE84_2882 [Aquimarina sp. MAR_2010_214]
MHIFSIRKTTFTVFSTILLILYSFTPTLSAQEEITQVQFQKLFKAEANKTKIIHINGGWCIPCFVMLPYVDYLNKHKTENIELTVILTTRARSKRDPNKTFIAWCAKRNITLNFYTVSGKMGENGLPDTIPMTYFMFSDSNLHRIVGWTDYHKEFLLKYVKKDATKTVEEVKHLYGEDKRSKKLLFGGNTYDLSTSKLWKLEGSNGAIRTGVYVNKGELVNITARGKILCGNTSEYITPKGISPDVFKKYNHIESANHGTLIAGILDESKESLLQKEIVGKKATFIAQKSGKLYLAVNDKVYQDNAGFFEGTIKRYVPAKE